MKGTKERMKENIQRNERKSRIGSHEKETQYNRVY